MLWNNSVGVSQMPTMRALLWSDTACVISPAGLVKFTSHACGLRRSTSRACSMATGMVRNAMATPAGPVVSCPGYPCAMAARSSAARPAMPPIRTLLSTKSAPSMVSSNEVAPRRRRLPPKRRTTALPRSTMIRSRAGSGSYSTISAAPSASAASFTPNTTRGERTPPPPINAILRSVRLLTKGPQLGRMGKGLEGAGRGRAQRTTDAAALDTPIDGLAIEQAIDDARVERVAGTGGIERNDPRRRHAAQAALVGDPGATGALFHHGTADAGTDRPGLERRGLFIATQQCSLFRIGKEQVDIAKAGPVDGIAQPTGAVADIQRCRAARLAQQRKQGTGEVAGQGHREMHMACSGKVGDDLRRRK